MPGELVPIVMFVMIGFSIVGLPIARAIARRIDRSSAAPQVPSEVQQRLERMEAAIEAIAVEVERISEGQRFTTKLLSERANVRNELPASAPPATRE